MMALAAEAGGGGIEGLLKIAEIAVQGVLVLAGTYVGGIIGYRMGMWREKRLAEWRMKMKLPAMLDGAAMKLIAVRSTQAVVYSNTLRALHTEDVTDDVWDRLQGRLQESANAPGESMREAVVALTPGLVAFSGDKAIQKVLMDCQSTVEATDVLKPPKEEEYRNWGKAEWSQWVDRYYAETRKQLSEKVMMPMRIASAMVLVALRTEALHSRS